MPVRTPAAVSQPPAVESRPRITIRPASGWASLDLREVWLFRDLLVTLAGRDLKVRYKQTALGVAWVVLQPLLAAGVFSFIFNLVLQVPSSGVPPLVFSFAGLLGWNFFSNLLNKTSSCLIGNSNLISKVFFPRLVLPISGLGSSLVDFGVSLVVMVVLLLGYRVVPSGSVWWTFPAAMAVLAALAMGIGLWAAALMVSYRDVGYILPVAMNILLYASPVAYSLAVVPARLRWVFLLNPLTAPIEALRNSLLGLPAGDGRLLALSTVMACAVLVAGMYAFKRMERNFADVI